eukprot:15348631-Heterocapsa_arctica.AAC.1
MVNQEHVASGEPRGKADAQHIREASNATGQGGSLVVRRGRVANPLGARKGVGRDQPRTAERGSRPR